MQSTLSFIPIDLKLKSAISFTKNSFIPKDNFFIFLLVFEKEISLINSLIEFKVPIEIISDLTLSTIVRTCIIFPNFQFSYLIKV